MAAPKSFSVGTLAGVKYPVEPKPLQLSASRLDVERIQFAVSQAITLPVLINGHDHGLALYLTVSPFAQGRISDDDLKVVARFIAQKVNGQ